MRYSYDDGVGLLTCSATSIYTMSFFCPEPGPQDFGRQVWVWGVSSPKNPAVAPAISVANLQKWMHWDAFGRSGTTLLTCELTWICANSFFSQRAGHPNLCQTFVPFRSEASPAEAQLHSRGQAAALKTMIKTPKMALDRILKCTLKWHCPVVRCL